MSLQFDEASFMQPSRSDAPVPDLRIVLTESLHPHEEYDTQRAEPLIQRLQEEPFMINPPIVAPIGASQFVILDGANRCHAFSALGYPHILVQVSSYDSGYVQLATWHHIVSGWDSSEFTEKLQNLDDVELVEGQVSHAIAHIIFRDGLVTAVCAPVSSTHERNAALRDVVRVYHQQAKLYRTALNEPDDIWPLYESAIAMVVFPRYQPADIIAAARYRAYIPPGISRHIVHGRALRINYPLNSLRDANTTLVEKNETLKRWLQERFARRQIRYYSEATYQFDE
jgi:hypothetical protein